MKCERKWCTPDISKPVFMSPFTWALPTKPSDYDQIIVRAAALFERKKREFYPIEKSWPPKRRSAYDSLMAAAREMGVCPDDLAWHVNRDSHRNERLAEEDAELRRQQSINNGHMGR